MQQTGRTNKQQLFPFVKATDLALQLQWNRGGLENHVPVCAVTQTGEVHGDIRSQEQEVLIEGLPQQLRDRKDATQNRADGLDT
nr:hypothetical protein [Synechococcus sp. MW101C3]